MIGMVMKIRITVVAVVVWHHTCDGVEEANKKCRPRIYSMHSLVAECPVVSIWAADLAVFTFIRLVLDRVVAYIFAVGAVDQDDGHVRQDNNNNNRSKRSIKTD
jgi:hypothetical protein